jgi:alcohol dehydrogenase class IV
MTHQETILRAGALDELHRLLGDDSSQAILAVIDETAYEQSGARERISDVLALRRTQLFTDFEPNPKIEDVLRGVTASRGCSPQIILAIGGGTAIDIAKLISCLAYAEAPINVVQGRDGIPLRRSRLITIPTTAGTGSEATQFAVVYMNGQKYSLDHPTLLPDVALIDPCLTQALPPSVTAATGLDALCQAIESIWAVRANDESVELALQAVAMASQSLVDATRRPTLAAREAMCRASHLAGQAINITRTTGCHALSYAITSTHGIPHGIAVALTLIPMLRFNGAISDDDCIDPRGAHAVRNRIDRLLKALDSSSINDACDKLLRLLRDIGVPVCLTHAGITSPDAVNDIVQSVNVQRMSNNPRRATPSSLSEILAWQPADHALTPDASQYHHASSLSHHASRL